MPLTSLPTVLEPYKWKPGVSPNPGGKPKEPQAWKALVALTKSEMAEVGSLIVKGDFNQIKKIMEDRENQPALKIMLCSCIMQIIRKGDMYMLDVLLNRLIGKPKEEIELSASEKPRVTIKLPGNLRETAGQFTEVLDAVAEEIPREVQDDGGAVKSTDEPVVPGTLGDNPEKS